ncbi:hypothetical protein HGRIS_012521 [Hohenbuehelia grisea]|uniref:AB hydrolase-1 domain-containing protein n=1 Tax=Hohenbuehelia grisea TaxID=104357 RepID=A0ABR3ISI4_9AGAR
MPSLESQSYRFDPQPDYPFSLAVKRLWDPTSPFLDDPDAYSLLFVHGTGFHKEQWEPIIEDLYDQAGRDGSPVKLREAWTIDTPNHGDSAVWNEHVLQQGYESVFAWEEIARSVHRLLSGLGSGVDVDFSTRKLVGIGHSSGAVGLILSTTYHPPVKYSLLHLVEPMILPYDPVRNNILEGPAAKRRDTWASKEEAMKAFQSRPSWQVWDPRVLKTYVESGLRPLPTAYYPDQTEGVTLKCPRLSESAQYRDKITTTRAYNFLSTITERLPIHILYGAVDDYVYASFILRSLSC